MRYLLSMLMLSIVNIMLAATTTEIVCPVTLTPKEALSRLLEGNERYTRDQLTHPDRTKDRREATVAQQCPFAVILGCADSRIPPEIIFDQGIGDLFVVRVAGNVAGPLELESIEYSVIYNHSCLVIVLGHENCGAVKAVLGGQTGDIKSIASLINLGIRGEKEKSGNPLVNAIKANVIAVVSNLKQHPVLAKYIRDGKVDIIGAYYNLATGKVEIL